MIALKCFYGDGHSQSTGSGRRSSGSHIPNWPRPPDIRSTRRLNELLDQEKFDEFAEKECAQFYADKNGRPSLTPGTYFRSLLIGYFEGIDSERGIAWRVADSLGLRQFLQIGLDERHAGSFDDLADAAADRRGDAPEGVRLGAGGAGRSRSAEGQDRGRGCHDAGSQRGDAVDRAARQRTKLRSVSDGVGHRRAGSRRRPEKIWRGWTGSGRRRGRTRSGRAQPTPTRASRR